MRKLASILALLAVVAFAGSAMADLSVRVEKQADPMPGMECYWIYATGAQQYEKFNAFNFTGVLQASYKAGTMALASLYLDDFAGDELIGPFDTHYLFNHYDPTGTDEIILPLGVGETNTKVGSPHGPVTGYLYGLGNFTGGAVGLGTPMVDPGTGVPFLQVVVPTIPAGTTIPFSGQIIAGGNPAVTVEGELGIVPEPGTIALLIGGALCLVAARFRRK